MLQPLHKKSSTKHPGGFTVIEVLIVLAVAGVILVVVFLAVPALQRGQRNAARKADVRNIAAAVNFFMANNGGRIPDSQADADYIYTDVSGKLGGYSLTGGSYRLATPDLTNKLTLSKVAQTFSGTGTFTNQQDNVVAIYTGAKCSTSSGFVVAVPKEMVILYAIEASGGGWQTICQDV